MKFSVSNQEGRDFLLNMFTARLSSPGDRVHSAYIRFTDEEMRDIYTAYSKVYRMSAAMVQANGRELRSIPTLDMAL